MAHIIEDRIKEITTSSGTGNIVLSGALTSYRPFSDVCAINDTVTVSLVAVDANGYPTGQWEIGVYKYLGGNTLERTTVKNSSNAGAQVDFLPGAKYVSIDLVAYQVQQFTISAAPPPVGQTIQPAPTGIINNQVVTLQSGVTYVGTIDISGRTGVTVRSSGSGKAIVTNGQAVTGWVLHSGNIYKAPCAFQPDNLSMDKVVANLAHYPSRGTRFAIAGGSPSNSQSINFSLPNTDVVGCTLYLKPHNSRIDELSISACSASQITFTGSYDGSDTSNRHFWIEGHKLHLLTESNSWCYSGGFVYLWASDGLNPSGKVVWASQNQKGINAFGSGTCKIDNVEMIGCSRGVDGETATGLQVLNSSIRNSTDVGIWFGGTSVGLTVDNCDIIDSFHSAVDCFYGSNSIIVRNCLLLNSGMVGQPRWARGVFIGTNSTGNRVFNNIINNTCYSAVDVNQNYNTTIDFNQIDQACAACDDGAGIYTQSIGVNTSLNMLIDHNTVTNSGLTNRVPDVAVVYGPAPQGIGIYLDDNTHGVTISWNTVKNCDASNINLHNAINNTISNNTLIADSDYTVSQVGMLSNGVGMLTGNVFSSNTHITRGDNTREYNIEATSDLTAYASYTGNTYNHHNPGFFARRWPGTGSGIDMDYAAWQAFDGDNGTYIAI